MINQNSPTFTMPLATGREVEMPYRPLRVLVGQTSHVLALHRAHNSRDWVVSDPISGGRILVVYDVYKGVPVSGHDLTEPAAAIRADFQVRELVGRISAARFNETIAAGRLTAPTRH